MNEIVKKMQVLRNFTAKAIEEIRVRHDLGKRFCLGYSNIPPNDISEIMKCPRCGGTLRYVVSSYDGCSRGMCETKGCLNWLE